MQTGTLSAAAAWNELSELATTRPSTFDAASLGDLPLPAARWLHRVLPDSTPLTTAVRLSMTGSIRIGPRWLPFTAEQVLRPGIGFVWKPVVGGRLIRFTGADVLTGSDARMEFRLHGLIPVARAAGDDTARSAAGRLAAETVAWVPEAATPQAGARWRAVDDDHAIVTIGAAGMPVDVLVGIDPDGRLATLELERWNDSADPPAFQPFGGEVVAEHRTDRGVLVAGSGRVGWGFGTSTWPDGEFFRYDIARVERIDEPARERSARRAA